MSTAEAIIPHDIEHAAAGAELARKSLYYMTMMREIEEYARTHRMQPEPERFHEGGQETAGSSRRARVAPTQWTRKDRLIFATGIAAALIVATGIALL